MKNILEWNRKLTMVLWALFLFMIGNFIIRMVLTGITISELSAIDLPGIFLLGSFNDFVEWFYFGIPITIFITLLPNRWVRSRPVFYIYFLILVLISATVIFLGISEWTFWQEFGKRFNFIAVDYLVYTKEVVGNIKESYNMPLIYTIVVVSTLIVAVPLYIFLKKRWKQDFYGDTVPFSPLAIVYFLIPVLLFNLNITFRVTTFENIYSNQLAGNGLYYLFNAYWNNELNYDQWYPTRKMSENRQIILKELAAQNAYVDSKGVIKRNIQPEGEEKRYNVMFITVESLSAEFFAHFGRKDNITPYLDKLADESLFFNKIFASGTRTVRGLEALTLSIPPTPGYSIVKRPNNESLFSLGHLFMRRQYDVNYIYAGYSYFDNMKGFFSHNGYNIIDRADFKKEEMAYANIWGVDDESMFNKVLKVADASYAKGKPFFNSIMTISNHRPYTYPDGRIDIPSKTGREGGVKFTDFSIGTFIEKAKSKPWFDNTIFVVVADHCHSSAGKSHIPVWKYHIPLIFYAPKIIQPQAIDRVGGQIDVAPTLLGLMNFKYTSQFLGRDLINDPENHIALLGTFQNLALLDKGKMVVMSPQDRIQYFNVDMNAQRFNQAKTTEDKALLDKATAYYQYASWLWNSGFMRVDYSKE